MKLSSIVESLQLSLDEAFQKKKDPAKKNWKARTGADRAYDKQTAAGVSISYNAKTGISKIQGPKNAKARTWKEITADRHQSTAALRSSKARR